MGTTTGTELLRSNTTRLLFVAPLKLTKIYVRDGSADAQKKH